MSTKTHAVWNILVSEHTIFFLARVISFLLIFVTDTLMLLSQRIYVGIEQPLTLMRIVHVNSLCLTGIICSFVRVFSANKYSEMWANEFLKK